MGNKFINKGKIPEDYLVALQGCIDDHKADHRDEESPEYRVNNAGIYHMVRANRTLRIKRLEKLYKLLTDG